MTRRGDDRFQGLRRPAEPLTRPAEPVPGQVTRKAAVAARIEPAPDAMMLNCPLKRQSFGIVQLTSANVPEGSAEVCAHCSVWNRIVTVSPGEKPSPLVRTTVPGGPESLSRKTLTSAGGHCEGVARSRPPGGHVIHPCTNARIRPPTTVTTIPTTICVAIPLSGLLSGVVTTSECARRVRVSTVPVLTHQRCPRDTRGASVGRRELLVISSGSPTARRHADHQRAIGGMCERF